MPLILSGRRLSPGNIVRRPAISMYIIFLHTRGKLQNNDIIMKKYLIIAALLCVSETVVNAQTTDKDSVYNRVKAIEGIEVSAKRTSGNILSDKPLQSIDKENIDIMGFQNVADIAKKFAGTSVKDYGGIGGMKTVSVRNIGAHHTAISYDGVTISNTQAGQVDVGHFMSDNIARLSLALGESSDQMQTARHYASAALLSIETELPHFDSKDWILRSKLRGGSFGLVSPTICFWKKLSEKTVISANATFMRADGTYPFKLKNGKLTTTEKRRNSDIYSWQGEVNMYNTFKDGSKLHSKAYYYYSERGLPGVVILYNSDAKERLWDENFFAQSTYKKSFGNRLKLNAVLKYTHSWNRYEDINVKYQNGKQTDINRQNEYYASSTLMWLPAQGFSVALAQDFFINNLRNNIETQPNPKRYTSLTALSAKYNNNRLTLNGNIVGTYAAEHVDKGRKPADRKRVSPSLSASYRIVADKSLFVRAMVKSTFRIPTFTDLYYMHIGNTGLKPEKATEYNAGMTWAGQIGKAVSMQITVDGYFNNVSDKIVAFPTTYVWKMANFGKVHIKGIDATMAVGCHIAKGFNAELTAAYTLQKATDKTDPQRSSYNKQLPYTPESSGNGTLTLKTPWLSIGYSVNACGERYSMSQATDEYRLEPYWEHSVTASRKFKLRSCTLQLSGSIYNLTDEQYEIIQYYPMQGRNWQLSATITL